MSDKLVRCDRSASLKVGRRVIGANRKPVCDFLSVDNSNLNRDKNRMVKVSLDL